MSFLLQPSTQRTVTPEIESVMLSVAKLLKSINQALTLTLLYTPRFWEMNLFYVAREKLTLNTTVVFVFFILGGNWGVANLNVFSTSNFRNLRAS